VTAGQFLESTGLDLSRVSPYIYPVDPSSIEMRPAPGWMRRLWSKDVEAMTVWHIIYVGPAVLATPSERNGRLILHELVHARQWRQLGRLGFGWRYLTGYSSGRLSGLSHRDAYLAIGLEVEARETVPRMV
jgi:hypothetical protein